MRHLQPSMVPGKQLLTGANNSCWCMMHVRHVKHCRMTRDKWGHVGCAVWSAATWIRLCSASGNSRRRAEGDSPTRGAMSRRMMQGMTGGDVWAFNGQSGMSDTPFHRFERGQTARIRLVNDTRFPHGIHLHGHHFFEIDSDGELGAFRDTSPPLQNRSRGAIITIKFCAPRLSISAIFFHF